MDRPIYFMFGSRVGFSRSADRMALFPVAPNPSRHLRKIQTAISPERDVPSTSCLMERDVRSTSRLILGWGFRGRRIEWSYFRLHQIQDGGWPPSWKISNGHISGTGRPIDFVFDPRVGFSGTADRMDLLPVGPNPRWRLAAILENFE